MYNTVCSQLSSSEYVYNTVSSQLSGSDQHIFDPCTALVLSSSQNDFYRKIQLIVSIYDVETHLPLICKQ